MKSLIACATSSLKEVNQDSCQVIRNEKLQFNGVVVADGLGSHKFSEKASAFVTGFLKKQIEALENATDLNFEELFKNAKQSLIEEVKNNPEIDYETLKKVDALSTTVICAIETEDKFIIAYAGNGSVWHIRGSFNQFSQQRYLPWNSINMLNPHCIEEGGKAALYRYISINEVQYAPTVVTISKNPFTQGEMIMIATDGIYTYDDVVVGKDEENKIWISGEETMEIFYKEISALLKEKPLELTNEDLQFALDRYLQGVKLKNIMRDDCTIGLIIPELVLKFQNGIIANKTELEKAALEKAELEKPELEKTPTETPTTENESNTSK